MEPVTFATNRKLISVKFTEKGGYIDHHVIEVGLSPLSRSRPGDYPLEKLFGP